MGDESSPEEKLRIASHFILSAPNGEVDDIIADVKTLMGSGSMLSDDVLLKLLKEYNTEQYVFAPLESGNNLPCSKFGASGSKFLDPSTGMTYTFDHVRRNWSDEKSAGSVSIDTPASGHRAAIEKALKKYMESFYVNAKEYATAVYDNRDDTITVVISAKKVNLVNYWSGGWKGTYVINLKKNKFHGHINVNVHYFEEGNVQLNTNIEHEQDIKGAVSLDSIRGSDCLSGFRIVCQSND